MYKLHHGLRRRVQGVYIYSVYYTGSNGWQWGDERGPGGSKRALKWVLPVSGRLLQLNLTVAPKNLSLASLKFHSIFSISPFSILSPIFTDYDYPTRTKHLYSMHFDAQWRLKVFLMICFVHFEIQPLRVFRNLIEYEAWLLTFLTKIVFI